MRVELNRIFLENGEIEIEVNDGYGETPSEVDFILSFFWINPLDQFERLIKRELHKTLEDALIRYNELDGIVGSIIFKEL